MLILSRKCSSFLGGEAKYNKNFIKIRDMRVDFYTLERRAFGQADGAHKCYASVRRSQNPPQRYPIKTLAVLIESVSDIQ